MNESAHQVEAARREIVELHSFFQNWFRGIAKLETFERLERALAPTFELITPNGRCLDRSAILDGVREDYGTDAEATLEIRHVRLLAMTDTLSTFSYEEWQGRDGAPSKGRISTVIFRAAASTPNALLWLHVHETWLPNEQ